MADQAKRANPEGDTLTKPSEDEEMKFASSSDESEVIDLFPRETCIKLRSRVRDLSAENCQLKSSLEDLKQQLHRSSAHPSAQSVSKGSSQPRLASDVAAAKISELGRRLREMCAELEATKSRQRGAEDKVAVLEAELEQLRAEPAPATPPGPQDADKARQLAERLSATNARLCDTRQQCAQLRHELQLAHKALASEVGQPVSPSQLGSFRGRAQQIIQLQRKVAELQERLGDQEPNTTPTPQQQVLQQLERDRRNAQDKTDQELKEAQAQLDETRRKYEGQRARTKVLEGELHDLKSKMSVLLQKGEHDDQLLATLTTQLRAAEEALRDRRSQHEVALQKVEDRRSQLEDQVAAHREQVNHLSAQLADRDKLVEQLKLRLERAEPPRRQRAGQSSPLEPSRCSCWRCQRSFLQLVRRRACVTAGGRGGAAAPAGAGGGAALAAGREGADGGGGLGPLEDGAGQGGQDGDQGGAAGIGETEPGKSRLLPRCRHQEDAAVAAEHGGATAPGAAGGGVRPTAHAHRCSAQGEGGRPCKVPHAAAAVQPAGRRAAPAAACEQPVRHVCQRAGFSPPELREALRELQQDQAQQQRRQQHQQRRRQPQHCHDGDGSQQVALEERLLCLLWLLPSAAALFM